MIQEGLFYLFACLFVEAATRYAKFSYEMRLLHVRDLYFREKGSPGSLCVKGGSKYAGRG